MALFVIVMPGSITRTCAVSVAETGLVGDERPLEDGMPVTVTVFVTKPDSLPVGGGVPWRPG